MQISPRLGLSLLAPGQAQKEITHNEALIALDAMVQSVCMGPPSNVPPGAASDGQLFLCGDEPTGAWSGQGDAVAHKTSSGWRFTRAFEGMALVDQTTGMSWNFRNGRWTQGLIDAAELRVEGTKVIGKQMPAIADPAGGTVADAEARATVIYILATLRQHGLIAT